MSIQAEYSEAGCGKTQIFATKEVIRFTHAGQGKYDIYNAESTASCLCQRGGIDRRHVAEVPCDSTGQFVSKKLKDILQYHHRQFYYDEQGNFTHLILRPQAWRGAGIAVSMHSLLGKVKGVQQQVLQNTTGSKVDFRVHETNTTENNKKSSKNKIIIKISLDNGHFQQRNWKIDDTQKL
jgi:hypothetical protein